MRSSPPPDFILTAYLHVHTHIHIPCLHFTSETLKLPSTMPDPRTYLDMAIPVVSTLPECADFHKTVEPYLPQLYDLPYQVVARISDVQALKELYLSTNPLISSFAFAVLFLSPAVLVLSEINRNYSQVDRIWSLLPALYNIHYATWAHLNDLPATKLDHVMAVSIIWSARLTFNYWRKGGYTIGSEDYRWNIVKDYIGGPAMFVMNVVFISFYQNVGAHICPVDTQFKTY